MGSARRYLVQSGNISKRPTLGNTQLTWNMNGEAILARIIHEGS